MLTGISPPPRRYKNECGKCDEKLSKWGIYQWKKAHSTTRRFSGLTDSLKRKGGMLSAQSVCGFYLPSCYSWFQCAWHNDENICGLKDACYFNKSIAWETDLEKKCSVQAWKFAKKGTICLQFSQQWNSMKATEGCSEKACKNWNTTAVVCRLINEPKFIKRTWKNT